MRIFKMDTLGWGKIAGKKLVTVDNISPLRKAIGMKGTLGWGDPVKKYCPENIEIKIEKSRNNGKLENLVGNLENVLMTDKIMKDIIEEADAGIKSIEFIPFRLLSSTGKLLSDDLYIINPVGLSDYVDKEKSEIRYHMSVGQKRVLKIDKLVLSEKKIDPAKWMFKIPEHQSSYYINGYLAKKLQDAKCENIIVEEIKLS